MPAEPRLSCMTWTQRYNELTTLVSAAGCARLGLCRRCRRSFGASASLKCACYCKRKATCRTFPLGTSADIAGDPSQVASGDASAALGEKKYLHRRRSPPCSPALFAWRYFALPLLLRLLLRHFRPLPCRLLAVAAILRTAQSITGMKWPNNDL